jgi:predicted PhzF superfamily epimerase YddE/YHI9
VGLIIHQVDAFTDEPFKGNPAGVCILDEPASEQWMQLVAMEMNLSETAFLVRREEGFDLRWFTPTVEVDLCGHATLAGAHVLYESGLVTGQEPVVFHTRSGRLEAVRRGGSILLDFPATPPVPADPPVDLARALGARLLFLGKSPFDYLVEVENEGILVGLRPDLGLLKGLGVRGVIVTAGSDAPVYDFVSRFFAPGAGIDEDPVTGSAHCCLGPFWGARLNKTELLGYQASTRGGAVGIHLQGNRVGLLGKAVTVIRAELLI